MNVEIFIVSIGLGVLGFALGFAKGSEVMVRHIRESFRDEGYDYEKFNDVINK
jgi:hypothetical protein